MLLFSLQWHLLCISSKTWNFCVSDEVLLTLHHTLWCVLQCRLKLAAAAYPPHVPIPNGLRAVWYLAFTFSHCQQTPAEAMPGISEKRECCYQVLLKVTLHCNCLTLQSICVASKKVVLCKEAKANSPAVSEGDSLLMREVNNLHTWSVWIHVHYKSFLKTACIDVRLCSEMSRVCHSCKQQECNRSASSVSASLLAISTKMALHWQCVFTMCRETKAWVCQTWIFQNLRDMPLF